MAGFLVSGLINIETTLRIAEFPLVYNPVNYPFHGVQTSVSGVGYNVAKALTRLGHGVKFLSLIGTDEFAADVVRATLKKDEIPADFVLPQVASTAQSVILYDHQGNRQIHVDLKDLQEQHYPLELFQSAAQSCEMLVLCNINFSRSLLAPARATGKWIATDLHSIGSVDDAYEQDFLRAAQIVFLSHENLPILPEDFARAVLDRYQNEIVVIGLGAQGALLAVRRDGTIQRVPAVVTRPVVNTIGAGDALFSAFIHEFVAHRDALQALRTAVVYASYKIGAVSAADGLLNAAELDAWRTRVYLHEPQSGNFA